MSGPGTCSAAMLAMWPMIITPANAVSPYIAHSSQNWGVRTASCQSRWNRVAGHVGSRTSGRGFGPASYPSGGFVTSCAKPTVAIRNATPSERKVRFDPVAPDRALSVSGAM